MTEPRRYQPREAEPMLPLSVKLPRRKIEWIRRRAAQHNISQSAVVSAAIEAEMISDPDADGLRGVA